MSMILLIPPVYYVFRKNENSGRIVLAIICSYMFILLALRSPKMGIDLATYEGLYNSMRNLSFREVMSGFSIIRDGNRAFYGEWGYGFVTWLLAKAGCGYQVFLILQAAFCVFSVFMFIDRNSVNPALSVALIIAFGFFDYAFSTLRQALSFAVLLFAVEPLKKRKIIPFLLIIVLAMLMHRTAAAFILVLPLSFIPVNKKNVLIFCGVCLVLVAGFPLYVGLIDKFLAVFNKQGYLSNTAFEFKEVLVGILAIALFLIFFADTEKLTDRDKVVFWAFMVALLFESFGCYIALMSRVSTLTFLPFAAVAIPNFMETREDKKAVRVFTVLIYLAAVGYYFLTVYKDLRLLRLLPYRVFFLD